MIPCRVWLRLKLPEEEFSALKRDFGAVEFVIGKEAPADLPTIDALFTDEPLADEMIQRMTRLRWLHVTRGGVYSFLSPQIVQRSIQVTGSKGIHGTSFSEFALACIFAFAKKLPQCWEAQKERRWERLIANEVAGKTLGILGLGTVGSELARKAKGLGLRVVATKRTIDGKPPFVDEIGPPEYLTAVLPQADFLVLCLPSVPSTEKIIGEKELRSMKRSALLVNLTTGKAIEEKLLVRALKEGWIAGAALDAFARQPLPEDSELWRLPNVLISPRIAGSAAQKWELLLPIFADNLSRFLAGERLRNVVDKERGY